jgi:hypothetical protein
LAENGQPQQEPAIESWQAEGHESN